MKLLSVDTETTGVDHFHGACPFFVTACADTGEQFWWEWDVCPLTRRVDVPDDDVAEIKALLDEADELVLQNAKFDAHALYTVGIDLPWVKVHDTLMAGHLLASNQPHDLTSMVMHYLGLDIEPHEKSLEKAVQRCRHQVQQARLREKRRGEDEQLAAWAIAEAGRPDMPSAKEKTWKYDSWLPKLCHATFDDPDPAWATVLADYANADSASTLQLWLAMRRELERRGLWAIYQERMKVLPVAWGMEHRGVTLIEDNADELEAKYAQDSEQAGAQCLRIAEELGYDLTLPKSGNNGSLLTFCFGSVGPKVISGGQTGVDQAALQAAKDVGLTTGGTAPKGWRTLGGPLPALKDFGLKQHQSPDYPPRTRQNVADAEATLQVYENPGSPGEVCTLRAVDELKKPLYRLDLRCLPKPETVGAWMQRFKTVNVAGNSERTCPGIGKRAYDFLLKVFQASQRKQLDLPVLVRTETGNPSINKDAMDRYLVTLDGRQLEFVKALKTKRKRDTAVTYLNGYRRFWLPLAEHPRWRRLRPSFNPTGTAHLRWSSSNPNGQNVGKQEIECAHCQGDGCKRCGMSGVEVRSLRYAFGPAPGREWWSLDFENIELRIPAYESGEQSMIQLFEKSDEPPFFGSYHLLNASIIYPDLFWPLADQKGAFKKKYFDTWYQWDKNFGFAKQYNCGEETGDRAAHKVGAWMAVKKSLPAMEALNQRYISDAVKKGFVETLPDKTVDPKRGYPIMLTRTEWGRVLPTQPLNYHVSGTAMWCTQKAMVRCEELLSSWRAKGFDAFLTLQVHDELVFDLPAAPNQGNLWRVKALKAKMERSGDDIGVPLKVSMTWNPKTWSEAG